MKNISKNKIYMIFGIVILLIAIAGSAYAYYSATASATISGTVAGSANLDLKVEKISTGATGNLIPVDNDTTTLTKAVIGEGNTSYDNSKRCIDKNGYTACQIYKITLTNKSSVSVSVDGGVSLSGDNTPNIECAVMNDINTVSSNSSCRGNKTLAKNYTIDANASVIYYIMVYIKNLDKVQTDTGEFNGTVFFSAGSGNKINADFSDKNIIDENAATYISSLYTNASKSTVTNNSITYNYATSVNLMNDRLGGTTTDLDGGNIRYYGASPNNYIYFNCSDYSNQTSDTCELWRIIGVFDGKIKIMRNSSIGSYSWDTSASGVNSGNGVNEWSQADLMKLLNPGYESESVGGSLYYNSGSGTCYSGKSNATKSCDFTSTGLKNDTTRNMIAKGVTWNTGGWDDDQEIYSNAMYGYERGNTLISSPSDGITRNDTWTNVNQTIALSYPSDYGYAADFNSCSMTLREYDDSACTGAAKYWMNNWMYPILGTSSWGWLLTPYSVDESTVWGVHESGSVGIHYWYNSCDARGVAPVLYLDSNISIVDNTLGTIDNPFKIKG